MSDPITSACTRCEKAYSPDQNDRRCKPGHLFDLRAWPSVDLGRIDGTQPGTLTGGLTIGQLAWDEQIPAALRDTGGAVLGVTDEETVSEHRHLAGRGYYAKDTAAVATAASAICPAPRRHQMTNRWSS